MIYGQAPKCTEGRIPSSNENEAVITNHRISSLISGLIVPARGFKFVRLKTKMINVL